ncbi:GntR family transcriptional regulator [Alicyclobacillus mengziensis]|uniref:GntR family transcriptional regulator n=1 Tax=Alicyclobacillus mengziensis TaxID=2931921 RepID=A0A9X7W2H2_9BACL|nr:GntR family transcriptional regulator [Alicyclobacillus mengziensis]QSO49297.1 GntR family transcriptional regulator [Alicyclobacillus mengziensis]
MKESVVKIDPNLPVPMYYQLKTLLLDRIENGDWLPGHSIPTEVELMSHYAVSRTTVREAVSALVQDGFLMKKQGRGTFVCEPKHQERLLRLTGFAEEMIQHGYTPSAKLIGITSNFAHDKEFCQLPLSKDVEWVRIERLRLASGVPIAIERSYWPADIADMLQREDLETVAYYGALERNGIFLQYAEEDISTLNADAVDAALLGVKTGTALMMMERSSYDTNDRLTEYTCTRYRGDRYKYHVRLER